MMKLTAILASLLLGLFIINPSNLNGQIYTPGGITPSNTNGTNNIGIGISDPVAKLDVTTTSGIGGIHLNTRTTMGPSLGDGIIVNTTPYAFKVTHNGVTQDGMPTTSTRTLLTTGGNLYLGSTTNFSAANENLNIRTGLSINSGNNDYMKVVHEVFNDGPNAFWTTPSDGPSYFRFGYGTSNLYSSNITVLKMSSEGRVAINTEDMPGDYHLYVNGKILGEEMVVKLKGTWPDYVFNPDYDLRSLYDLKDFIGKNKHLPGLPSAQQVADEGVDVGATQAAMLEKIEELTLYVIELQEQIDLLEERMKGAEE